MSKQIIYLRNKTFIRKRFRPFRNNFLNTFFTNYQEKLFNFSYFNYFNLIFASSILLPIPYIIWHFEFVIRLSYVIYKHTYYTIIESYKEIITLQSGQLIYSTCKITITYNLMHLSILIDQFIIPRVCMWNPFDIWWLQEKNCLHGSILE